MWELEWNETKGKEAKKKKFFYRFNKVKNKKKKQRNVLWDRSSLMQLYL